jgi:hypothetical protein
VGGGLAEVRLIKMLQVSDNAKIGILLVSLGLLFLSFGVLLFFDAGLMAIGECFVCSVQTDP